MLLFLKNIRNIYGNRKKERGGRMMKKGAILCLLLFTAFSCRKEGEFQKFGEISLNTKEAFLPASGELRHPVIFIDVDGNGRYDGIDLNGDGIPEVLFTWPFSPSTGLDVNGDGRADYYMFLDELNRISITRRADGSGGNVQVVVDKTSTTNPKKPIGFDTNSDCEYEIDPSDTGNPVASKNPSCIEDKILQTIYQDTTPPTATANLTPGAYASPIDVTVVCSDNVACNAITYSFGLLSPPPDDPTFDPNYMKTISAMVRGIKAGDSVTIPLTGLLPGAYQIKFIARDANGNTTSLQTLNFTIGEPAIVTVTSVSRQFISRQAGAYHTTNISFWSDKAGTFKLRKAGTCTHADFDAMGNPTNNPSADVAATNAKGSLSALVVHTATVDATVDFPSPIVDGKKTVVICFRDSSTTIITKKPVEIYLDNAPPIVIVSPDGGNFATDITVGISCADNYECEGILARVGPNDGTPPTNPNGSSIPLSWPYNLLSPSAYMSVNTDYFTPNSHAMILAGPAAASTDPDPYNYTYKIVARDKAGNISTIKTTQYALGGQLTPLITRIAVRNNSDTADLPNDGALSNPSPPPNHTALPGYYYLRAETGLTNNGHQALRLRWKSNRAGTYQIRIGDCTSGTISSGANAVGSALANEVITSQVLASDLVAGNNDVRVCFNSFGNLGEGYISVRRWQFNPTTAEVTVFDRNAGETATIDLKNYYAPTSTLMQGLINNVQPSRYTSANIDNTTLCSDSASWNGTTKELTITTTTQELCNYVYTHTLVDPAGINYGPVIFYVYSYEDKNNAIFVGGPGANDANSGTTRNAPKATLSAAIAAATPAKKDIYIYNAITPLTTTLNLPSGVSLYGGYKTDGSHHWMRKTALSADHTLIVNVPNTITTGLTMSGVHDSTVISGVRVVVANANVDGNVFGAFIDGGSSQLIVRRSTFTAGNTDLGSASPNASSSYGFYAKNLSTLQVLYSFITAGQGQQGDSGSAGFSASTPGGNGGPGQGGISGCTFCGNDDSSWIAGGAGGGGGTNTGKPSLNGHPGGGGGRGAPQDANGSGSGSVCTFGENGQPGSGPLGGAGGAAGNRCQCNCNGNRGGNGGHGGSGADGVNGSIASPQGYFDLATLLLQSQQGGNGTDGVPGSGGGGGGGGGNETCYMDDSGSGGGGGGGGGAAGSGGIGGYSGGSSVGLALVNINSVTLTGNSITRSSGGNGGMGGTRGTGSAGGSGGSGGGCNDDGGAGGSGGSGGAGGHGGHGAGGNGGHSFGILRYGVPTYTGLGNTFSGGGSGLGGSSGGNSGSNGLNHNCFQYTSPTTGTTCTP